MDTDKHKHVQLSSKLAASIMPFPSQANECVKVLFASCAPDLLKAAVSKASSIRPELPLWVVSEIAPPAGNWVRYEAGRNFLENLRACRRELKGRRVEVAIIVSQPEVPHRRLRWLGFLTGSRCIVILNEHLDYFDLHLHSAKAIGRHLFWRAEHWILPATFRVSSASQSSKSVKVLFASCAPALIEAAVAKAASIRPELPLVVVAGSAPPQGRWIHYDATRTFLENVRYCRGKLMGKQVELAILMSQPRVPHRRLRLLGFLAGPLCLAIMNENLDYFDVHPLSAGKIVRQILSRARNRILPASFRSSSDSHSVKVLFTSCAPALMETAVRKASSIRPELPLVVVSEFAPAAERWIRYQARWTFLENLRYCRTRLKGRRVELAIVLLEPQVPYQRLRLLGLLTGPGCLVVMNENLDYLDLHPRFAFAILRHVFWRARNWVRFRMRAGRSRTAPTMALRGLARHKQRFLTLRAHALGFAMQLSREPATALVPSIAIPLSDRAPGTSVVIPSRNGRDLLERMLPAILNQLGNGEVIVVDDGSDDATHEFLSRCFPAVTVLRNPQALGFAAAVNVGIRAARFSHVCLLNNDMAVAPGFFWHLQQAFETVPGLFCASPQVFLPGGLPRQETGKAVIRSNPDISDFPIRCDEPVAGEDLTYVMYGSSGCSMFEAERLLCFHGLDESYKPAYVEDLDLGFRAWQQGWPTVFVARANVVHEHRATMSKLYSKDQLEYTMTRNWLLFLARTVRRREVFTLYWRHAVARLSQSAANGNAHARQVLGEIGVTGKWRARRQTAAVSDSEIFALCNGSVSVFPGGQSNSSRPVVLIASPYLPFPLAHGGAVRMYNLMRRAAANWKQVLISFVDEPAPVPPELLSICAEVITVHRTGGHHRQSTSLPDVVDEFHSPSFRGALRQTARKWRPEIVQLEFTQLAQYAPDCAGARTILTEHDITFDLYQQLVDGFDDWHLRRQLDRWTPFERAAWSCVDRVVTMSQKDQGMVQTGNAVVIPNGVDLEYFQPCPEPPDPGRLLFLGSFRHFPNLAGLDLFLKEVWPVLRPLGTRLHVIAGPEYRNWLAHYRERIAFDLEQPGVKVEEFVADVRPAYRRAEIVIVPLPVSAGTNIKVLEAMSMGKAIVTTTQGVNGLRLIPGDGVMVADTPGEFAVAIRGLLQNRILRRQLEVRARQIAKERFGWDSSASLQDALYEELRGCRT